jgi:hypothetical protein
LTKPLQCNGSCKGNQAIYQINQFSAIGRYHEKEQEGAQVESCPQKEMGISLAL